MADTPLMLIILWVCFNLKLLSDDNFTHLYHKWELSNPQLCSHHLAYPQGWETALQWTAMGWTTRNPCTKRQCLNLLYIPYSSRTSQALSGSRRKVMPEERLQIFHVVLKCTISVFAKTEKNTQSACDPEKY
jgi:hypothetical protein